MNYTELLKSRQLSLTQSRILLLKILSETDFPLSGKDIERMMMGKCDRATIYRNLNAFSGKGIIQRILSDDALKFKMNADEEQHGKDLDHIHFQCNKCHKVICMEDLLVKDYELPEGFSKIENQFLVVGICKNCNGK